MWVDSKHPNRATHYLLCTSLCTEVKDQLRITEVVNRVSSGHAKMLTLIRALSVSAFLLMVAAQIYDLVGIARVPTYHTVGRDGGILQVPAPATILEVLLAVALPVSSPVSLHFIGCRRSANHVSRLLRTALPCTVIVSLWFITCFGAMNEQIQNRLGVVSVNVTVTELTTIDNKQMPMLLLAPFLKVPALLCIISCCLLLLEHSWGNGLKLGYVCLRNCLR
jgi:hypothetical protein